MKDIIIGFLFIVIALSVMKTPDYQEQVCIRNIQNETDGNLVVLKLCNGDIKIINKRNLRFENNEYIIADHSLFSQVVIVTFLLVGFSFILFKLIENDKNN